jgi:hypothetical protein
MLLLRYTQHGILFPFTFEFRDGNAYVVNYEDYH